MYKILCIKKADFFGVPFLQNINQQQALFKSTLGGLLSLLISVTSLAYAFWIIYLWKSNQMSPKISNSKYVSDYKLLDYNSGRISVYYEVFEGQVDPFESRILLPLVMYTDQFAPTEPMIIENYIESSIGKQYGPIQIYVILTLFYY